MRENIRQLSCARCSVGPLKHHFKNIRRTEAHCRDQAGRFTRSCLRGKSFSDFCHGPAPEDEHTQHFKNSVIVTFALCDVRSAAHHLQIKHRESGPLHNDVIFSPVESYILKIYILLSGYTGINNSEHLMANNILSAKQYKQRPLNLH